MQEPGEARRIHPGGMKCLAQKKQSCMALCVLTTAQRGSTLWTVRCEVVGKGVLEFHLRLGEKAEAKYEGLECQA